MSTLLQRFFDVCLLRAGPQDIPASRFLLWLALGIYVCAGVLMALNTVPLAKGIILMVVDASLLGSLAYLVLWVRGLSQRYIQVFTALAGSGALLELIAWPVLVWQQQAGELAGLALLLPSLLLWAWLLWNLAVIGHILRHALSTAFPIGVVLALFYMFISFSISRALLMGGTA